MNEFSKRKTIRIKGYDYSTPGAYFITICTANRQNLFWARCGGELCSIKNENRPGSVGAAICRPQEIPLSSVGKIVEQAILQIADHYEAVSVDKYCIMPDHIHLILRFDSDANGRQVAAPTVPTVVGHMKRWVSMQLGCSIWQKSYFDHGIRNQQDYNEIWEYIEGNPLKWVMTKRNDGSM